MTQEEKARAYDEVIKKVNDYYEGKTKLYSDVDKTLNYLFPELAKSKDERIRQFLIHEVEETSDEIMSYRNMNKKDVLAWLKKQGEHTNFRNKIQVGDKVTRNKDGVLVNLSQLDRVAKKDNKQGEQKFAWSEEDEDVVNHLLAICAGAKKYRQFAGCLQEDITKYQTWLKSLKDKIQPQSYNPYKAVVESISEMCKHYDKASHSGLRDFYDNVKVKCKDAKEYEHLFPQKPIWNEEDSIRLQRIIDFLWYNRKGDTDTIYQQEQDIKWLKSLKEKVQPIK